MLGNDRTGCSVGFKGPPETEVFDGRILRSPKKLRFNKKFEALPVDEGDEFFAAGIFEFNITKLLAFVAVNLDQFPVEQISVKEHAIWGTERLDEKTVDTANVESPILLGEISPNRFNVIDGNHRLERARRLGLETIPAARVRAACHHAFLTSKMAYEAYVKYWNSKVSDGSRNVF